MPRVDPNSQQVQQEAKYPEDQQANSISRKDDRKEQDASRRSGGKAQRVNLVEQLKDTFQHTDYSESTGTPTERLAHMSADANKIVQARESIQKEKDAAEDAQFWAAEKAGGGGADSQQRSDTQTSDAGSKGKMKPIATGKVRDLKSARDEFAPRSSKSDAEDEIEASAHTGNMPSTTGSGTRGNHRTTTQRQSKADDKLDYSSAHEQDDSSSSNDRSKEDVDVSRKHDDVIKEADGRSFEKDTAIKSKSSDDKSISSSGSVGVVSDIKGSLKKLLGRDIDSTPSPATLEAQRNPQYSHSAPLVSHGVQIPGPGHHDLHAEKASLDKQRAKREAHYNKDYEPLATDPDNKPQGAFPHNLTDTLPHGKIRRTGAGGQASSSAFSPVTAAMEASDASRVHTRPGRDRVMIDGKAEADAMRSKAVGDTSRAIGLHVDSAGTPADHISEAQLAAGDFENSFPGQAGSWWSTSSKRISKADIGASPALSSSSRPELIDSMVVEGTADTAFDQSSRAQKMNRVVLPSYLPPSSEKSSDSGLLSGLRHTLHDVKASVGDKLHDAKSTIDHKLHSAKVSVDHKLHDTKGALESAKDTIEDKLESAKDSIEDGLESAKDSLEDGLDSTKATLQGWKADASLKLHNGKEVIVDRTNELQATLSRKEADAERKARDLQRAAKSDLAGMKSDIDWKKRDMQLRGREYAEDASAKGDEIKSDLSAKAAEWKADITEAASDLEQRASHMLDKPERKAAERSHAAAPTSTWWNPFSWGSSGAATPQRDIRASSSSTTIEEPVYVPNSLRGLEDSEDLTGRSPRASTDRGFASSSSTRHLPRTGSFTRGAGLASASDIAEQSRLARLEDKIEDKWHSMKADVASHSHGSHRDSSSSGPMDLVQTLRDEPMRDSSLHAIGARSAPIISMMSYRPAGAEWDIMHDRVFEEQLVQQME